MVAHGPIVLRTWRRRHERMIAAAGGGGGDDDAAATGGRRLRTTFDLREVRRRVYFPNGDGGGDGGGGRGESRAQGVGRGHRAVAEDDVGIGGDDEEVEEAALRPPVADHSPGMDKVEEGAGSAGPDGDAAAGEGGGPPSPDDDGGGGAGVDVEVEFQDGVRRYPWWVQLGVRRSDSTAAGDGGGGGGENTAFMSANPETRRSHSAAILRLPGGSGSAASDGGFPTRQRGRRRRDTEADADGDGGGGGGAADGEEEAAPNPEVGAGGEEEPVPVPVPPEAQGGEPPPVEDVVGPDATPPPPPPPPPESSSSPDGAAAAASEYMIVSGGFTDEDWSSFPVYAYDLSATHGDLRQTTSPDSSSSASGNNNFVDPPTHPPAGGWIRLGTGTSADLTKRQHEREHSSHGWGSGQKRRDPGDGDAAPQQQPQPLWPPGRVGHVTAVSSTTGDLFVFGGMMYYDREFHAEDFPVVWRASGIADGVRSASSSAGWDLGEGGGDRRIQEEGAAPTDPNATDGEGGGGGGLKWTRIEPKFSDYDYDHLIASDLLTRGEAAGGHWIDTSSDDDHREYLIFHGGLHIKSRGRGGAGANTIRGGGAGPSGGYTFEENLDVPLGDVWAFDLKDETFTRLAEYPPVGVAAWDATGGAGTTYPIARTAHAATIDGDKLVIYGGMTMGTDVRGWAATSALPQWEMLDDVWAFDLVERRWIGRRDLYPNLARSYHSLVGRGDTLVACGGYRTAETIAGESIAFVFSDTLVSLPNTTRWYKAVSPTGSSEGLPHRLSHTSVLDSLGSMYVWGGRFRTVSQIAPSVWRLDLLHGDGSRATDAVALSPADPDGMDAYEAELQTLHLMVAVMIFMSVLFTTLYGTLRRGVEEANQHGGGNNGVVNLLAGGGGSGRTTRRGGVRQDVIDSFPVKTFDAAAEEEEEAAASAARSRAGDGGGHDLDLAGEEEEACCAICLLEYEDGDEVRTLPCGHDFHKDCVDSWLWNNTSCPACRHSLSSVVPQSSSEEEDADDDGGGGDVDADAGGGLRAARPSRWFVADRIPIFLRRPVFSILSEGEEHHGNVTPPSRRGGGDEGIVVDDDPADRYVASDLVSTEGERNVDDRIRPIGGRLGASFGRHLRPSPQARPVMMELVTYNVSSEDPYRL